MERINILKPLKVKAIVFKNDPTLFDRVVYIAGDFLIVGQDEEDTAPTWYNLDQIDRLEGVEQLTDTPRHNVRIG